MQLYLLISRSNLDLISLLNKLAGNGQSKPMTAGAHCFLSNTLLLRMLHQESYMRICSNRQLQPLNLAPWMAKYAMSLPLTIN